MSFAALVGRHARSIVTIACALAAAGLVAAISLPVGLFPQVSFPRVVVDLSSGDRPADQTALTVTRPVEEAIRSMPGVSALERRTPSLEEIYIGYMRARRPLPTAPLAVHVA